VWHFYHCYAAGSCLLPLTEHCRALTQYGLRDELAGLFVGFVGSDPEIDLARGALDSMLPGWQEIARAETGWEQVTLDAMYDFVQTHDGPVSYAHTKGASRNEGVDLQWRRGMTYHNFVTWQRAVAALDAGKTIVGCNWICGGASSVPGYGTGGMFGGNFWWVKAEDLRRNVPPGHESRYAAEHWLGQLSEVMPITVDGTIEDLCPNVIYTPPPEW
jgi:hypothetical protein